MNTKRAYHKRKLEAHNAERLKYLSAIFRTQRFLIGFSRCDVESEFGISRSILQRAESSNPANLTLKTVFEIADIYEIPIEELFHGVE